MTCTRLEHDALLAELGGEMDAHVESCDTCRASLQRYQPIAALLAGGATAHRAPPDFAARAMASVRAAVAARRRRRRLATAGAVGLAVAAAVLFWVLRSGPPAPAQVASLVLEFTSQGSWRGDSHVGDELRARARLAGERHFAIRVYRSARELLHECPQAGAPGCQEAGGALLVWTLPSVGAYQVLMLVSAQPIAASKGTLDGDVAAATAAGAKVVDLQTFHVR